MGAGRGREGAGLDDPEDLANVRKEKGRHPSVPTGLSPGNQQPLHRLLCPINKNSKS